MFVCNCSNFDKNFGSGGATISLIYFSGNFNNVTFSNHKGPVVRVSNRIIFKVMMHNYIHSMLYLTTSDIHNYKRCTYAHVRE